MYATVFTHSLSMTHLFTRCSSYYFHMQKDEFTHPPKKKEERKTMVEFKGEK